MTGPLGAPPGQVKASDLRHAGRPGSGPGGTVHLDAATGLANTTATGSRGHWSRMTPSAFEALPSRLDHRDSVPGQVYRDPENPGTVFLYRGRDDWRAGFLSGRPGIARNDAWTAREAVIVEAE